MAGKPGTGGQPPKPTEVKKRQGTYRKDRDRGAGNSALAVVREVEPVEPSDLAPAAAMARVHEDGAIWLAKTDSTALAMLREALQEREALRSEVIALPFDDKRSKALRDLDKQIIGQLSALGFDPAARARLGLAEVKAKSKLEEIRERQTKRAAATVADEGHEG